MKRMFFYNAVKLWNNVSDKDLVCSSDVKKFKRNYFDSVQCVNSRLAVLKLTESFSFLNDLIFQQFILKYLFKFLFTCKFE